MKRITSFNIVSFISTFLVCFLFSTVVFAQKKKSNSRGETYNIPAEHYGVKKTKKVGRKKKKKQEQYQQANFNDFVDERQAENADKRRKMKKAQYSDPMNFGHKRKPKKRKPGKQKYCKECGLVH